jgi:hypothetical protein
MKPEKIVLLRAARMDTAATAESTELDLGPYINVGKRQIIGAWAALPLSLSTDTDGTYDNKFQESATTVSSDFSDITGASFTQVVATATAALETVIFSTNKRYIRSVIALGGTAAVVGDFTVVGLTGRYDT